MKKILSYIIFISIIILFNNVRGQHMETFSLQSTSIKHNGIIPTIYTCEGKDISPQLSWKDEPDKTIAFTLILSDPDAPGGTFYHWVLFNIPKNISALHEGSSLKDVIVGKNSWGKLQYNGPCPPKGSNHHYYFTLYAQNALLNLPSGSDAETVINALKNHTLAKAELMATFSR